MTNINASDKDKNGKLRGERLSVWIAKGYRGKCEPFAFEGMALRDEFKTRNIDYPIHIGPYETFERLSEEREVIERKKRLKEERIARIKEREERKAEARMAAVERRAGYAEARAKRRAAQEAGRSAKLAGFTDDMRRKKENQRNRKVAAVIAWRQGEARKREERLERIAREERERVANRTHIDSSGYFANGLMNTNQVVDRICTHLRMRNVDFDTIVVTGVSGGIIGPLLAFAMGKKLLVARKDKEGSHCYLPAVGQLGRRWIFVDDFICSGASLKRTYERIKTLCARHSWRTEFVGCVSYENSYYCDIPDVWDSGFKATFEEIIESKDGYCRDMLGSLSLVIDETNLNV